MPTVLIVEDDPHQREIIRVALETTFLVLEADTPAKALEMCEHYLAEIDMNQLRGWPTGYRRLTS